MEVLLLAVVAVSNIVCFMIGAKVTQAASMGEKVELPVNPVKAVKEHLAKKEAEHEQSKLDTILSNMDSYDGTSNGQKEVPRG